MTHLVGPARWALVGATLRLAAGCASSEDAAPAPPAAAEQAAEQVPLPSAPPESAPGRPASALLQPARGGDGDSWRDTAGQEYRLGLVNTPERGECYAREATAERTARTAAGFRAAGYSTDGHGRSVAVVTTADGVNLSVHLARHGFADDRYLARFRHENPALAEELDAAFAAAKREGAGLWSACRQPGQGDAAAPPAAAEPTGDGCHPDYLGCVPVQGDGSGRGHANDLDCGDLSGPVRLRAVGVDPYRLDADGDGVGCD